MAESKVKVNLLKDWDTIRQLVKRGLKKLGHDIPIVCMNPENERRKKECRGKQSRL